jgi:hypothetical protein
MPSKGGAEMETRTIPFWSVFPQIVCEGRPREGWAIRCTRHGWRREYTTWLDAIYADAANHEGPLGGPCPQCQQETRDAFALINTAARSVAARLREMKTRREAGVPGAREGIWVRPVSWRGTGRALDYNVETHDLDVVPFANRATQYTPTIDELIEEWELVNPADVLKERP